MNLPEFMKELKGNIDKDTLKLRAINKNIADAKADLELDDKEKVKRYDALLKTTIEDAEIEFERVSKGSEMMNKNQRNVTPEEMNELFGKLTQIMNVIQLQNHHLDFIPSRKDIPSEDIGFYYGMVNGSLGTLHEINQDIMHDLDDIASRLSEIADELEQ